MITVIAGIMGILSSVFGPEFIANRVEAQVKESLSQLSISSTKAEILKAVTTSLGQVEDTKLQIALNQIGSFIDQVQIDAYNKSPEGFYYKGWRPFVSWGMAIPTVFHQFLIEVVNINNFFHGRPLQPLDYLTVMLITSLLGVYMVGRSTEKITKK